MSDLPLMKQYWENRHHLTVIDNLLLFDDRIGIPSVLRQDILQQLHEGHEGITKTKALASTCVWWPYISSHIETMVNKCATCAIHRPERREPLLPSSFPDRPWSRLAMDLFELRGKTYLIIVNYFSRWIELRLLEKLNSKITITQIKSVFATYGIPDMIISDNGPSLSAGNSKFLLRIMGSLMSLHLQDTLAATVRQKGQFEQSKTCSKKQLIHMIHFCCTVQHH